MPRPSFLIERRVDVRSVTIEVYSEYVRKSSRLAGVQGAGNVTEVIIIPDNSWDGMAKTITWFDAHGENPVKVILPVDGAKKLEDGRYAWSSLIPPEPLKYAGECSFVMDGFVDGKRARTIGDKMEVAFAPYAEDPADPSDPTPSQAEQLQKQMDQILATIQDANDAAKSAEESLNAIHEAIDNLPEGATLVIDNMTTGGKAAALSAEQGKLLGSLSNLTNPQLALANLGAWARPTLLRNGIFVGGGSQKGSGFLPINQRGKLSYSDGYTIDGWKLSGGTLTVKDDCIELEAQPENFATFECAIEGPSNYSGKTLTLSALAERISGTEYCYITNIFDEYKKDVAIPDAKGFCSLTDTAGTLTSSLKFVFVCGKGCKIRIYAAKMEEGDFHTLGWMDKSGLPHLFVGPEFGGVLSECQRYLFKVGMNNAWGYADSSSVAYLFVPTPVTMRSEPVWSGRISKLYPYDGNSVTLVSVWSLADGMVCLQVQGTGFTPGKVYSVSEVSDGFLSAEL